MKLIDNIRRKFRKPTATEWSSQDWSVFAAKQSAYRTARSAAAALPPVRLRSSTLSLASKTVTQDDLSSAWARYWLRELGEPFRFHRQPWEFAYVLQSLRDNKGIGQGVKALVLGEQRNPLLSYLSARGVKSTVLLATTDPAAINAEALRNMAHRHELISGAQFDEAVSAASGVIGALPTELGDFDVVWSIDHLNRLGDALAARQEVLAAVDRLRPGGTGVFIFDLDLSSNGTGAGAKRMRRGDVKFIAKQLIAAGHYVAPLNFKAGGGPLDCFIDTPPYAGNMSTDLQEVWGSESLHLKLMLGGAVCTSFGLTVTTRPAFD